MKFTKKVNSGTFNAFFFNSEGDRHSPADNFNHITFDLAAGIFDI